MKSLVRLALGFVLVLVGCGAPAPLPEMDPITVSYAASDEIILNPERGFYSPVELSQPTDFSVYRSAIGNTLVHANVRLDAYREQDLPQDFLDQLDTRLSSLGASGVKIILRFAYNQGPYPDSEPDASKARVLRHIEQLAPILQRHAPVIAWLEAGFIGAWGEWHTSTHGLDNLADKQDILFALLAALPPSRMVQVRYPNDLLRMFPTPLTEAQAFSESQQARIGHHNDCFLSSDTDVGTYARGDGANTIVIDQAYLAEITRFTPTGGETCAPNPPRSECASALQEMALLHFTEINLSYHQRIIDSWRRGGCFEEMQKRLGYRLGLREAAFTPAVRPGGVISLNVRLENTGFASLINPRPVLAVLDGPARYTVTLPLDPRRWEAGTTPGFSVRLRVPAGAPEGTYRLALWLPDAADALRDNPLYAVRLANTDVWDEATGFNILSDALLINADAPGAADKNAAEFAVIE